MSLLLPAQYYSIIYNTLIAILSIITVLSYLHSYDKSILYLRGNSSNMSLILSCLFAILLSLFIGLRPISGRYFVDMAMYAHSYNNIIRDYSSINLSEEWLWVNIAFFCKDIGLSDKEYFVVCEFLYIIPMLLACIILTPKHVWISFLLVLASFSFYAYSVNGIRNGVGCSISLLAIAMLTKGKYYKIVAIILMFAAYNTHHSTALPCMSALIALFILKNPKYAIAFWGVSIIISLVVGNAIGDIFANLGFDDRTHYFEDASLIEGESQFSSTGFRFDFLIYSAMPVLMVWYLTIKRNFNDIAYNIIANTYILANAFWIMVIRAEFSNRFAYLSWFMYPIVIAYPLLRMNIWDGQDRKAALIIAAYSGFTLFMHFIYYG